MVLTFLHLAILGLSLVFIIFFHRRSKLSGFRLPPGNKGWPIIGETLEFAMNHRRGCPEKFVIDRMCKFSPEVFKTSLFGEKLVVFCGASGNKLLFSSHSKYVTSWWPPSMAKVWYFPENQENTVEVCNKMRSVLPEFLKPDALQDYIPVMDSMAKEQLETDWSPHKQVQVFSLSKKYTFASACKVFMNLIDPEQLTRLSNPFTHIVAGLISIPIKIPEQVEIAKSKTPGELLNWDDVKKMKYSWCVACEAMRLSPPVPGTFREAITDFTYAGFTIPKGWKTFWTTYSTNRNPDYFPDPEKFDPSRFEGRGPAPYSFVPFGGGPRMCPGKEYARLATLVFMHNVVTKFKWRKVNPDEKIIYNPTPTPENGLLIHLEIINST
ncbi:hypothetical protein D5086_033570 [Populus alba]|uniref:Uncharacterized protein n=1 Tax=Populus alba TaxID=43335 RepID=A0ACC4AH51_POPAL